MSDTYSAVPNNKDIIITDGEYNVVGKDVLLKQGRIHLINYARGLCTLDEDEVD